MLLSILVPVYNVENYIHTCISSLIHQSGMPYEIVLLDDGSTDQSGVICDEYASQYPELIRVVHKQNEGLLLTRRRGFKEAKGDWVACVDSDDYVKENYLQIISDAIQLYNCDMLMFDYESFYPDEHTETSGIELNEVSIYEKNSRIKIYEKRLLKNKYNNMWSKVCRKSILNINADYSVYGVKNMCEDAIQSYELYNNANKIVFIPKVLYCYRRNIQSITSNVNLDYWYALRVSYELGWDYIDRWKIADTVIQAYGSRCISYYCDFMNWLFTKCNLDNKEIDKVIHEYMLDNRYFKLAVDHYRKAYLATKYLKLRNPRLIKYLQSGSPDYRKVKMLFKIESALKK